ncbi:MAG: glycosyltransferase [Planctomycetota bacterium]
MTAVAQARVLHLFANYKWTGPADPAIRAAARLRARGVDVVFAQAGFVHRGGEHRMAEELERWRVPVVTGLELRKHFHIASLRRDVHRLRAMLQRDRTDVLHCHLPNDHLLGALACRRLRRPPVLVRTLYDAEAPARGLRQRFAFARTHGVLAPTPSVAEAVRRRFALPADRVLLQEPVTEPRALDGPSLRAEWGLGPEHRVVGITARIQPHRRFELLWATAQHVCAALPAARFVLLGRGNEHDTERLVRRPIQALGLQDRVILPGYQKEPRYAMALRALDAFLFLVPGSDGTCRAVRDALAFGLPVVSTRRGMLPEITADAGAAVDETPAALGDALLALLRDDAHRRQVGAAALRRAREDMDPVAAARALAAFYDRLLRRRPLA